MPRSEILGRSLAESWITSVLTGQNHRSGRFATGSAALDVCALNGYAGVDKVPVYGSVDLFVGGEGTINIDP